MKKTVAFGVLTAFLILTLANIGQMPIKSSALDLDETNLTLVIGSPLVLSDSEVSRLDSENPDIAPKIISRRTLVPLRSLAEHFGAEVSYSDATKEATISYAGKEAVFTPAKMSFTFDGTSYPLDVPARIYEGRMLVPLRAAAEIVLSKTVSYDPSGIIYIGSAQKDISADTAFRETVELKIGQARRPQTTGELKEILAKIASQSTSNTGKSVGADEAEAAADAAPSQEALGLGGMGGESHSETNVQVEGIDEADIVKTDGKYLYVAAGRTVYVVSASGADMKIVSKIALDENRYISEIYASDGRLVVIGQKYSSGGDVHIMEEKLVSTMIYPYYNKTMVFAYVYDVSAADKPEKVRELEVEGNLSKSRRNGDFLYIVANKYVYGLNPRTADDEDIMPVYKDGENAQEIPVGVDRIICPPVIQYPSYTTVASLDLSDPDQRAGIESILGATDQLYMNESSLYLTRSEYQENGTETIVTKFSIDGTKIGYSASGAVSGYLQNQFFMDEHNQYLRIATSDTQKGNCLFVLDDKMNIAGSITGIAKGEQIYSVRFLGNAGYIVTFRTIDPLFAIDLSDPKNPVIKGELKVPGFSDYLHPVGENLLLGIGRETRDMYIKDDNGKETVVGTYQGGIKLSLFDVSNMSKPVEKDVLILGGAGSYAEALYNHKSIMTDTSKNLIGFDASLYNSVNGVSEFRGALLIRADENGISESGRIESIDGVSYDGDVPYSRRLLYVGSTLYYLQDGMLRAFNYSTLKELTSLTLK